MRPDTNTPDSASRSPSERGSDSPALFQCIVAEVEEGVVVMDPNGLVIYANPAAEFLLGQRREDLTADMFGFSRAATAQATAVNVISRDGRVRMVELRAEPLVAGPNGSLLVRLKDVTTYHEDITSAREQVRRRDEFLAMLSHELRTPLAAIQSTALLLARDDVASDDRRAAAEVFDRQFKHLRRILDDLLDVTRISRGKLEIIKQRVELNRVVRDAITEATPLIARQQHRLRVDLATQAVWVEGDPTRLEQVVVNLLNNAAKFTPPKGNVSVSLTVEDRKAAIRVRDDGPGIAADVLPHVFEPFIQGKQTVARSEGGLGIGLSLVQTIVLLHGGSVCAEPNPDGTGVSFCVELPLSDAGAHPPATPRGEAAPPRRILLVEDRGEVRRVLKQLLELDGHTVIEADDGPSGLAALLEQAPDVALLDIGLPGMDGYEVARRARHDERGRNVRLIAVTGYGMPEDVRKAREAGFDDHLIKPVDYAKLCALLGAERADGSASHGGAG